MIEVKIPEGFRPPRSKGISTRIFWEKLIKQDKQVHPSASKISKALKQQVHHLQKQGRFSPGGEHTRAAESALVAPSVAGVLEVKSIRSENIIAVPRNQAVRGLPLP